MTWQSTDTYTIINDKNTYFEIQLEEWLNDKQARKRKIIC